MKTLLTASVLLLSMNLQSHAAVSTGQYSPEDLARKRRCSAQECKLDDDGARFLNYCSSTIPPFNGWVYTMNIYQGANFSCYCPCELGFIGEVRQSNQ